MIIYNKTNCDILIDGVKLPSKARTNVNKPINKNRLLQLERIGAIITYGTFDSLEDTKSNTEPTIILDTASDTLVVPKTKPNTTNKKNSKKSAKLSQADTINSEDIY